MTEQPHENYPNQPQPPRYGYTPTDGNQNGTYRVGNYDTGQGAEGAYSSYAHMYGQGLPTHMEKPEEPGSIKTAVVLSGIIWIAAMVSSMLSVFYGEEILAGSTSPMFGEVDTGLVSGETAEFMAVSVVGFILSLAQTASLLTCLYFIKRGHNWARIVNTVFLAIQTLSLLSIFSFVLFFHWTMLIGVACGILAIPAIIVSWLGSSNEFMRRSTAYRQWEKQRAYET